MHDAHDAEKKRTKCFCNGSATIDVMPQIAAFIISLLLSHIIFALITYYQNKMLLMCLPLKVHDGKPKISNDAASIRSDQYVFRLDIPVSNSWFTLK